jgi:hypothetical protein
MVILVQLVLLGQAELVLNLFLNFFLTQSSSAFSRIITTAPTAAGIMGEIRFNTSNNKMYIWNCSAWRVVDTTAS